MNRILKQTKGHKVFGISIVQDGSVNDDTVEQELQHMLEYLDTNLSLMNQYADRRFRLFFSKVYPQIGFVPDKKQDDEAVELAVDTTIEKKEMMEKQPELDYRRVPSLIHLLWHEILLFSNSILESLMDSLTDEEFRKAKVLDSMSELLKALFVCTNGKKALGIPCKDLETPLYRQLRYNIDSIYKLK